MPAAADIANIFQALKDWRHWVGNDVLDHLGVPDAADKAYGDARFLTRLQGADMRVITAMLRFFELGEFAIECDIWKEPGLKLFISHVTAAKDALVPLTRALNRYGVSSFMAHEAIAPMKNWQSVLLKALGEMKGLLSFHSQGFSVSQWCSQEVGFALGRDVPVIPVIGDELPLGFVGALQAMKFKTGAEDELTKTVFQCLAGDERTRPALAHALSRKLKFAGSYDAADFYIGLLRQFVPLEEKAEKNVLLAVTLNDKVRDRGKVLLDQPRAA